MKGDTNLHQVSRRSFIASLGTVAIAGASTALIPGRAFASGGPEIPMWPGAGEVRQIWIQRREIGESAVLRYYDGSQILAPQYSRACELLRDVHAGQIADIDVNLLDLMFAMQRWLVSWGIDRPLIINSGFRTRATNRRTEGAAKESMHIEGRAADIAMPGVPVEYLGQLAAIFSRGGVGFYLGKGFVHIDTGKVRYWSDFHRTQRFG